MHEDAMENSKNLRPSGATSEAKASKSDAISVAGKACLSRNGKKRENVVVWNPPASGAPSALGFKSQQRPWPPSKQRGPDKRQKSKAGSSGFGAQRQNDYQVMDMSDPELESLVVSGGVKKQNLAHMLNMFQLAPRDSQASSRYWRATHHSSGVGDRGRGLYNHSYHAGRGYHNKDHYLQANCQFVVKADGDYTVYLADPDLLVAWESIEQIRIWDSEAASCPICLHPPVASRMTRCGHVYCWPCVLHFLALSDKPSRPCPICDAPVRIADLKSVVALEQRRLKVGDTVEMRLMKRDRHSLEPQPVRRTALQKAAAATAAAHQLLHLAEAGEDQVFSKLLLCAPHEVVGLILSAEKAELEAQLEVEKDCPESCFIQQALEQLAMRESNSLESFPLDAVKSETKGEGSVDEDLCAASAVIDVVRSRFTSMSSDGTTDHLSVLAEDLNISCSDTSSPLPDCFAHVSKQSKQHHHQQKNTFYFYQSSDGQAIFLHPINVQMLVRCYGSLEHCPEVIQGTMVEAETLSMTEELRHRLRYLGHLPMSKPFQIMEIELTESIVEPTVLEEFRERIEERKRRRLRKDREERRRDLEIQRAEEAKWGRNKSQPINVRLDSQVHFPGFLNSPPPINELDDPPLVVSPTPPTPDSARADQHGPSFAQMLREGKNQIPSGWPRPSSSASKPSAPAMEQRSGRAAFSGDVDCDEDYSPPPEYKDMFSSALAAAFDQAANSIGSEKQDGDRQGKGKKKKSKQKIVFSTGMNFM